MMEEYRSYSMEEMEEHMKSLAQPSFRGKQLFKWIHRGVEKIDDMTDMPASLRELLKKNGYVCNMEIEEKLESKTDGTVKYLMMLKDLNVIECVFMRYSFGNTICISTQAGCSMGCSFCASTIGGKIRDLTPGEMLGQVIKVQKDMGERISNVVLMGTGEPMDNLDNVLKFLSLLNYPDGINIGMRHITISTCGIVEGIKELARLNLQLTLAVSLHAPNDEIRRRIMPVAHKYSMEELMDSCRYYTAKTNRRITFEYALIKGVNDSDENARELGERLKGMLCHVNLIPVNQVRERDFQKSVKDRILIFKGVLERMGIETTIRRELGSDISAACGQLRRSYIKSKE
jgi:23S rRNA (adenine2503-C2)-methyltransferase